MPPSRKNGISLSMNDLGAAEVTTVLAGSGSWLNGSTFLGSEAPVYITVTDAFDLGQFAAKVFLKGTGSEGGKRHGHRFIATAANARSVLGAHQLKMLRSKMSGCFGKHRRGASAGGERPQKAGRSRYTCIRCKTCKYCIRAPCVDLLVAERGICH